jgi:hypothetical protein
MLEHYLPSIKDELLKIGVKLPRLSVTFQISYFAMILLSHSSFLSVCIRSLFRDAVDKKGNIAANKNLYDYYNDLWVTVKEAETRVF